MPQNQDQWVLTLSRQNTHSVIATVSVAIKLAVEGYGFKTELGREGGNGGVSVRHGGLCEMDLCLCQGERPPAFSTPRPGGGEASRGALSAEVALELSQRAKMPKIMRSAEVLVSISAP